MKLLVITLSLLIGIIANAAELVIVNHTGGMVRIKELRNKCDDYFITQDKPVFLENNERYVIKNVTPVVQTYTVCGNGFCSSSAIGMKDSPTYTLNVVLDRGTIDAKGIPDHWTGSNIECPKGKK